MAEHEHDIVPGDWEQKAIKRVLDDFERAEKYLKSFHQESLERYEHYRASQKSQTITGKKDTKRKFPTPFTAEQVDTFRSLIMDKLYHRNKPCTIYGREETDKADAEAKQALFDYQDDVDKVEQKTRAAVMSGALYGIMPSKVDYKEVTETEIQMVSVPVTDDEGVILLSPLDGLPIMVEQPQQVEVPVYRGASVEPIDILDLFFTPEKKEIGDGEPVIIRSRHRPRFFEDKPIFFNTDRIRKKDGASAGNSEADDMIASRKRFVGLEVGTDFFGGHCTYLEWQGYYDPKDETLESPDGKKLEPGHYVIGVITGGTYEDVLVRFDFDPLKLGTENIILGTIMADEGSNIGESLIDKFHAIQHGMDTLMGIWLANLKQLVKRPKVVNSGAVKFAHQINNSVDEVIEVETSQDLRNAVMYVDVPNISPDVYAGMQMFREMGQNATRIRDSASGKAPEGAETLGEVQILQGSSNISINDYLKQIESTYVRPLYQMRNKINSWTLDTDYVIRVIGEKGIEWRTLSPAQIRSSVDFVCEASSREMERGVISQQIIQAMQPTIQLMQMYAQLGYPPQMWPRPDILMAKLGEQWTWSEEMIEKIWPSTKLGQDKTPFPQIDPLLMAQGAGQGPQSTGAGLPQSRTQGEVEASAQGRNQTQVGRL